MPIRSFRSSGISLIPAYILLLVLFPALPSSAFQSGEILLSQGDGKIEVYQGDHLNRTLNVGITTGYDVNGICVSTDGQYVYATSAFGTANGRFSRFNKYDTLLNPNWIAFQASHYPVSCVTDATGNVYIGIATSQPNSRSTVNTYDANGQFQAQYTPDESDNQFSYMDLAPDQCTLFYTTGFRVKRYNLCTQQQQPDFADLSDLARPPGKCNAVRVRQNGEVLVTCSSDMGQPNERHFILRLDSAARTIRGYDVNSFLTYAPGDVDDFMEVLLARETDAAWVFIRRPYLPSPPLQDMLVRFELGAGGMQRDYNMPDARRATIYGIPTGATTECSDGIDNDGNGSMDYPDDRGCNSRADTSEAWCIHRGPIHFCLVRWHIVIAITAVLALAGWVFYRKRKV